MLCAVCGDGWYRRSSTSICTQCAEDMAEDILFTLGVSVGIAIVVVGVVLLDLRFGFSRAKAGSQRLKSIVNCVQQMTVMILFPVEWPEAVKDMGTLVRFLHNAPTCMSTTRYFVPRAPKVLDLPCRRAFAHSICFLMPPTTV